MLVNLNVQERLTLSTLLPVQGDRLTLKIIKGILDKVELSVEEADKIELTLTPIEDGKTNYRWNLEKSIALGDKSIDLNAPETDVIQNHHKMLNDKKLIFLKDLSLWDKLLGGQK